MAGHTLYRNTSKRTEQAIGFTIVELLIVIVVIGILAAITIVAFNGVSGRARVAQVQSDLTAVSKKLRIDQTLSGSYPTTLAATDGGKGVPASPGTNYQYTVNNALNPPTFCVTAVNGSVAYFVTNTGTPTAGTCPGDSATGVSAPTMVGYQDFSPSSSGNTMTYTSLSPIPDGSWMMMDIASTNVGVPTTPAGWTALVNNDTTNTMQTSVYGKIKTSSDTDPLVINMGVGTSTTSAVMFWGSGAGSVSNWVIGTLGKRASNGSQQYVTVSPTITTSAAQSLVLSISNERTTADETDVTSVAGATKWFFNPQQGSKIQTETVSSAVLATPGTSSTVTVTYPNAQTFNGMAFQIGLPPA